MVVRANPAGTRVYVGGDFTDGRRLARGHVAAFDVATGDAGRLQRSRPTVRCAASRFAGDTVYVGGNFRSANGQPRDLLAAFSAAPGGQMTSWAPAVDGGYVWSMVMSPDQSPGDRRRILHHASTATARTAWVRSNASTGATEPWAANGRIRSAGLNGAISSLPDRRYPDLRHRLRVRRGRLVRGHLRRRSQHREHQLGQRLPRRRVRHLPDGPGRLHGVATPTTARSIDGFPDTNPRSRWQKAGAVRTYPTGTITKKDAYGWDFTGLPYSGLPTGTPTSSSATITTSKQAAWTVTGNSDYVVLGGEFPTVNGIAQQGLVRFAKRPIAPQQDEADRQHRVQPGPTSTESGKVRVLFSSIWDRDDATITYDVFRSPLDEGRHDDPQRQRVLEAAQRSSPPTPAWRPGSSVRYQVRATDADGNIQYSAWSPYVTVSDAAPSPFARRIAASDPAHHWRLNEPSGPVLDSVGDLQAAVTGGTLGAAGAVLGGHSGRRWRQQLDHHEGHRRRRAHVSVEAWVKTTSTRGGRVVGFGAAATGTSASGATDRVLYLDNSGRANFAINNGSYRTVTAARASTTASGTTSSASPAATACGCSWTGCGWAATRPPPTPRPTTATGGSVPTRPGLRQPADRRRPERARSTRSRPTSGTDGARSTTHYVASGRTAGWSAAAPPDAYGAKVVQDVPDLYWRLNESSGTVGDASTSGQTGGPRHEHPRADGRRRCARHGLPAHLGVGRGQPVDAARRASTAAEVWFKTTATTRRAALRFRQLDHDRAQQQLRPARRTCRTTASCSFGVLQRGAEHP